MSLKWHHCEKSTFSTFMGSSKNLQWAHCKRDIFYSRQEYLNNLKSLFSIIKSPWIWKVLCGAIDINKEPVFLRVCTDILELVHSGPCIFSSAQHHTTAPPTQTDTSHTNLFTQANMFRASASIHCPDITWQRGRWKILNSSFLLVTLYKNTPRHSRSPLHTLACRHSSKHQRSFVRRAAGVGPHKGRRYKRAGLCVFDRRASGDSRCVERWRGGSVASIQVGETMLSLTLLVCGVSENTWSLCVAASLPVFCLFWETD